MRYKIVVITGPTDWETFQALLKTVLRALTKFPQVAVSRGLFYGWRGERR
jgi:hypothetical protein